MIWSGICPIKTGPNRTLNNALTQTAWQGPTLNADTWRETLYARLENIAWEQVIEDVRPFITETEELSLLTRENVLRLLLPI